MKKAKSEGLRPVYKYEIIIYWSNEDHAFIAEVPELPGCIASSRHHKSPSLEIVCFHRFSTLSI